MDRKQFIKKGLFGTGMFAATIAFGKIMQNDIDEIQPLEILDVNQLPNHDLQSIDMENMILHKANTRGLTDHGWLESHQTFSFGNYYNPERMHFGVLRVLNDDRVDAGRGFGTHPHDNMEIISIPLEGDLEHKDSMGNTIVIKKGDIQVISAGTGIFHSEFNKNEDQPVKFLQIWVYPNKKNISPRYDQVSLSKQKIKNKFQQILSPNPEDEGVSIHQDAWFHLGTFDQYNSSEYNVKKAGNGIYVFIIKGSASIAGQKLDSRDGLGIWDILKFTITANEDATEILLMDVPMSM